MAEVKNFHLHLATDGLSERQQSLSAVILLG